MVKRWQGKDEPCIFRRRPAFCHGAIHHPPSTLHSTSNNSTPLATATNSESAGTGTESWTARTRRPPERSLCTWGQLQISQLGVTWCVVLIAGLPGWDSCLGGVPKPNKGRQACRSRCCVATMKRERPLMRYLRSERSERTNGGRSGEQRVCSVVSSFGWQDGNDRRPLRPCVTGAVPALAGDARGQSVDGTRPLVRGP